MIETKIFDFRCLSWRHFKYYSTQLLWMNFILHFNIDLNSLIDRIIWLFYYFVASPRSRSGCDLATHLNRTVKLERTRWKYTSITWLAPVADNRNMRMFVLCASSSVSVSTCWTIDIFTVSVWNGIERKEKSSKFNVSCLIGNIRFLLIIHLSFSFCRQHQIYLYVMYSLIILGKGMFSPGTQPTEFN